jgi:hypothetical protein
MQVVVQVGRRYTITAVRISAAEDRGRPRGKPTQSTVTIDDRYVNTVFVYQYTEIKNRVHENTFTHEKPARNRHRGAWTGPITDRPRPQEGKRTNRPESLALDGPPGLRYVSTNSGGSLIGGPAPC